MRVYRFLNYKSTRVSVAYASNMQGETYNEEKSEENEKNDTVED